MEADDIESSKHQATKYSRVNSNGTKMDTCKKGSGGEGRSNLEDKKELVCRTGSTAIVPAMNGTGVGVGVGVGAGNEVIASNRFGRQWQHSSRIIRVSRASGGKDRHSKVWTAKGPRDRRVRLSVTTAIQFYDLQDRLGYDQPSKAVEWLIKAAAESINELPSLNNTNFPPETLGQGQGQGQGIDERRSVGDDSALVDFEQEPKFVQEAVQQQQVASMSMSMSKSGCSSNNSETSKGSGLSLSRTEIRVKARERARERTAKEKENEPLSIGQTHHQQQSNNDHHHQHQQQHNVSSMSQASSFTQLLTAGISNVNDNAAGNSARSPHHGSCNSNTRGRNDATSNHLQWLSSNCTTPMAGFFETGLMGLSTTRPNHSMQQLSQVMTLSPFSSAHNDVERQHQNHHHPQQQHQHFPFMTDQHHHLIQVPNSTSTTSGVEAGVVANGEGNGGTDYNLNFSISSSSTTSGLAAGFNRGTLQSNSSSSPSLLSYLQRFSATDGGVSSLPFFLGGSPISPTVNNQHIHPYDPAGLQLCYGDHSDQKGKGKN